MDFIIDPNEIELDEQETELCPECNDIMKVNQRFDNVTHGWYVEVECPGCGYSEESN